MIPSFVLFQVKNVETLILNFNDMEITDRYERHRIFSNFESLRNLHLTDAFTDSYNASAYYLRKLEDIFIESNLRYNWFFNYTFLYTRHTLEK